MRGLAGLFVAGLTLALIGACSVDPRSQEFACESSAQCEGGRECIDGWCVVPGATSTGDGDGDATTTGDGDGDATTTGDGDGDATTTGDGDGDGDGCPAVCTSCQDQTCVIDCTVGACDARPTCPAGLDCQVVCGANNQCLDGVDCTAATSCTVACTATSTCLGGVDCGTGSCTVDCAGNNSCEDGVVCGDSCACDVSCGGNNACATAATCPGSCDQGRGCRASGTCDSCP